MNSLLNCELLSIALNILDEIQVAVGLMAIESLLSDALPVPPQPKSRSYNK